jgi:hypothetical protein
LERILRLPSRHWVLINKQGKPIFLFGFQVDIYLYIVQLQTLTVNHFVGLNHMTTIGRDARYC